MQTDWKKVSIQQFHGHGEQNILKWSFLCSHVMMQEKHTIKTPFSFLTIFFTAVLTWPILIRITKRRAVSRAWQQQAVMTLIQIQKIEKCEQTSFLMYSNLQTRGGVDTPQKACVCPRSSEGALVRSPHWTHTHTKTHTAEVCALKLPVVM